MTETPSFVDTLESRRLAIGLGVVEFAEYLQAPLPTVNRWRAGIHSKPHSLDRVEERLRFAEDWIDGVVALTIQSGKVPPADLSGFDGVEDMPAAVVRVAYARSLAALRKVVT